MTRMPLYGISYPMTRFVTLRRRSLCPRRKAGTGGFTFVEVLTAMFVAALVAIMFFAMLRTWGAIDSRVGVQADLNLEGKLAFERILRSIRQEMVGIHAVSYQSGDFQNALIILADTDHDGEADLLKGWGVRPLDENGDGEQDQVDVDGDDVVETDLWELVAVTSASADLVGDAWNVEVLCRNLAVPWLTAEGVHLYRPFEFFGSDPSLDVGLDGEDLTGDAGEHDGYVSEAELGNFVTQNGVIDAPGEVEKISTIGIGLRFLKASVFGKLESVIVYQGTVDPRNWKPFDYRN